MEICSNNDWLSMDQMASPWMRILIRCAVFAGAAVVVVALVSLLVAGGPGFVSALFGGALVMAFFAISLLIGHWFSRQSPTGTLAIFAITYVVKFLGFAAALIIIGSPGWLQRISFFIAALLAVLVWQSVELLVFSKVRLTLFGSEEAPGDVPGAPESRNRG